MKHSETEWSARWGTRIPANEQNIVALDIKRPAGHQLVVLPDGGADLPLPGDVTGMTAKTRAGLGELHCAAPHCGRFATTVGGASRHHFRHPTADGARPGHDPETKEHFAAKHAIAQWIRQSAGPQVVRVEVEEYMTGPGTEPTAKPDVYVELNTGAKIAVEYQHSRGKPKDLLRKTKFYQEQGTTVWWLYGPGPRTCNVLATPDKPGITVELTSNQRELARLGISFFWFDATRGRVGTPLAVAQLFIGRRDGELWQDDRPRTAGWYARKPFTSKWRTVKLDDAGLDACEVDVHSGELITPGTRAIARDERQRTRRSPPPEQLREPVGPPNRNAWSSSGASRDRPGLQPWRPPRQRPRPRQKPSLRARSGRSRSSSSGTRKWLWRHGALLTSRAESQKS